MHRKGVWKISARWWLKKPSNSKTLQLPSKTNNKKWPLIITAMESKPRQQRLQLRRLRNLKLQRLKNRLNSLLNQLRMQQLISLPQQKLPKRLLLGPHKLQPVLQTKS